MRHARLGAMLIVAFALLPACGDTPVSSRDATEPAHALLGEADEMVLNETADGLDAALAAGPTLEDVVVLQPEEGEALVADDRAPRFLWRDAADGVDTWYVAIRFGGASEAGLRYVVRGAMPAEAVLDPLAAAMHAWTPTKEAWAAMIAKAVDGKVGVTIVGFGADAPSTPRTRGSVAVTLTAND